MKKKKIPVAMWKGKNRPHRFKFLDKATGLQRVVSSGTRDLALAEKLREMLESELAKVSADEAIDNILTYQPGAFSR